MLPLDPSWVTRASLEGEEGLQPESPPASPASTHTGAPGCPPPRLRVVCKSMASSMSTALKNRLPPCFHFYILKRLSGWECCQKGMLSVQLVKDREWISLQLWHGQGSDAEGGWEEMKRTLHCLCCCPLFTKAVEKHIKLSAVLNPHYFPQHSLLSLLFIFPTLRRLQRFNIFKMCYATGVI